MNGPIVPHFFSLLACDAIVNSGKKKEKKGKSGAASVSGYLKKINYPSVGARMSREPEVGSRP